MKIKFSLIIPLLLSSSSIISQIVADRPGQTESSLIINSGQIQIETGIDIAESETNINSLFRIGILDGIEVRLKSNYLVNDEISYLKKSSFTDFEIGTKIRALYNDKIKIGFIANISVPTAPEIFSNNDYGLLTKLLISHNVKASSQIGSNFGYNKFKNLNGEFHYSLLYKKSLGYYSVFFEIFGDESSDNSNLNFDTGITYLIDNHKQLDLSILRGLNNNMFYLSAGFSINIF